MPHNLIPSIGERWSALITDMDAGREDEAMLALREIMPLLRYVPSRPCPLRDFVQCLALLANNAPTTFQSLRQRVLDVCNVAKACEAAILSCMLGFDDRAAGHVAVVQRLIAAADLDLLKAVTGSVPDRTGALLTAALDAGFLRNLADAGKDTACFTAAVALAAIGADPAAALLPLVSTLPDSAAGNVVRDLVDARVRRLRALAVPAIRPARLRIALCLSGQLRGWQEALATWAPMFEGGHHVSVYVHSWRHIGRKLPHYPHYFRSFAGAFLAELDRCVGVGGDALLGRDYPHLLAWFTEDEEVDAQALQEAYRTRHVVLEDDRTGPLAAMAPAEKMYDKVERCFDLARAGGQSFDVLVRLRPDKSFYPSPDFDWRRVRDVSMTRQAMLADYGPLMHQLGDLIVGDQFGCGVPEAMEPYLRAASTTRKANAARQHGFPHGFYVHRNFAYSCVAAGIRMLGTPDLHFGPLHDASRIAPAEVLTLLQRDIAGRPQARFDDSLLEAARRDAQA